MRVRSLLFAVAALGALLQPLGALAQNPFESEIQAYEAQDRVNPPPLGSVVVTGSSSIVKWTTIQTDLAPLDVIARGFGGSTTDDLDYYLQRIVLVYKPRAVVIYEGENDMDNGKSPTYVRDRMAGILGRISAALPNAHVYVISIKPSPAHIQLWNGWETYANQLLAALCATDARYTYIDVASHLIYPDNVTLVPNAYVSDGVHLSWYGYQLWTAQIRPVLLARELPSADTTPPTVPGGLSATAQSSSRIDLAWNASTDSGSGVGGYNVFRNGTKIATTTSTSYSDTGLKSNTLYTYTLTAFDRMSPNPNESAQSAPASATTQTIAKPPPTVSLQVDPSTVAIGGTTQLSWTSTNATACSASDGWAGAKGTSGSATSSPLSKNTTFTLSCTGDGGTASDSKSVAAVGPPTVSLALDPATVASGGTTKLSWTTSSATSCTASGGWSGTKPPVGSETSGALTVNTTFTLTCTGVGGTGSDSKTATVAPAPTVSLTANPTSVANGAKTQLSWTSTNASSCSASGGWSGGQSTSGSATSAALSTNTSFTLTCTGSGGSATATANVTVTGGPPPPPAPTVQLSADTATVAYGGTDQLKWSSTNATSCTASGAWTGSRATSGAETTPALTAAATFTLTCSGAGGDAKTSVTVAVNPPATPTTVLTANPASVAPNGTTTLSWTSTDATACTASNGWTGSRPPSGTETSAALTGTTTFALVCTGPGGTSTSSIDVAVTYPQPTVTLSATPATVTTGAVSKLSWVTQNASDCAASGAWDGKKALAGDEMTAPLATQSAFNLSCTGPGGTANATVMVDVQSSAAQSGATGSAPSVTATSGGGGGALDWWDVSALLALLALRRLPDRAQRWRRATNA